MALLFMDSFDHYATADASEKWTSASNIAIGAYGRNGTNGLRATTAFAVGAVSVTVLGGINEAIVGVAIKPVSHTTGCAIIMFGSANDWECGVFLNDDLTLRPCRNTQGPGGSSGFGTLLGTSSVVALQVGVWAYVELRMKCDNSTGTATLRVNGVEAFAQTGLDTLGTSAALTRVGVGAQHSNSGQYDFDDLVVMDTTGSVNNSFLGDVTVSALYPNGAGTTTGWTPSAGSNYDNANETAPNDDTDYNATATVGTKDTYAMQDCAVGADIRAVQILASVRKGAEGPGQVKLVVRSGGADYDGAAQGIGGTSYSYVREVYETDPGSGSPVAAWSESGWNAVEIGLKKTG